MASEKIEILEDVSYYSIVMEAIRSNKTTLRIPTGDVLGQYEEKPLKEGIEILRDRDLFSSSQYSEIISKLNLSCPEEETSTKSIIQHLRSYLSNCLSFLMGTNKMIAPVEEPSLGIDISKFRIRSHEDLEALINETHKLALPIADGRSVDTTEAILWAKEAGLSSPQQSKNALKIYLTKLATKMQDGDLGAKKEIIRTLSVSCEQGILEFFRDLELLLDLFNSDPILRHSIDSQVKKDKLSEMTPLPLGEPLGDLQEVNQAVSEILDESRIASKEIIALKEENDHLKRETEDQKDKILKLKLELGELRAENEYRDAKEANYLKTLEEVGSRLEYEERQNGTLQQDIDMLRQSAQKRDAANNELQEDINEIQKDNDTLRQSAQERDAENSTLHQALEEKGKETSELQKTVNEQQQAISTLEQSAQERDAENTALHQALEEKDKETSELQDMHRVIKAEEKVALKKTEKLEKDMANLQEHIASLVKERDGLEIKITNILEVGQAEKAELQEKAENLEAQKDRSEERTALLSGETLRQRQTLDSVETERNKAQEELEALKERFSNLEIKIVGLQTERSLIAKQTQRLKVAILSKRGALNIDQDDHEKSRDHEIT